MSTVAAAARTCLLEGLPPLVQGIAESVIVGWERAVSAVPELERLAAEDLAELLAMAPVEREEALRRRWDRLNGIPTVHVIEPRRPGYGSGRTAAAR